MRQRNGGNREDLPSMCSGCKGFYARGYKARHQVSCPANGANLMLPVVSISNVEMGMYSAYSDDFKALLGTLKLDAVGDYVKSDNIILMIGARSFKGLKRRKDKSLETKRFVRARMRLITRLYLQFHEEYCAQSEVVLSDQCKNAADLFRRETITVLGKVIDKLCDKCDDDIGANNLSITNQKSGLKISILNMLKLASNYMIGYYLIGNEDERSERVVQFLRVLKLMEDDLFADAYYDINYRKNVQERKPINLPDDDDVKKLLDELKVKIKCNMFNINI